ncbi:MAG TPA: Sec-independent protein translocase protein TatB [Burkholderiales bacterium]|nr:Sec-independent protein translocase protein TatB [Burkholderiales bacterium]
MFDIGFSEMIVIAVIALIVLGPEKLPRVARTAGHLLGRMQRYVNDVKADINREIELDELRKLQKEMQSTAQSIEHTVKGEITAVESEFKQIGDTTQKALSDPVADAFADPPPVQSPVEQAQPSAAHLESLREPPLETASVPSSVSAPSAQLELGLDAAPLANAPPPVIESASAAARVNPKV